MIYWDPDSGRAIGGFLRDSRNATARLDSIVAFGRDGSMLASPSEDGTAVLWSAANEPKRVVLKDVPEPPGFVATVVAVDADHRMIALAQGEGDAGDAVSLWDLQTGRRHAVLDVPGQQVVSLAFSPDGATLAGGTSESRVLQWDVSTGKAKGTPLRGHDGRVNAVAFSSDGRTLASGGSDHRVLLWDTRTRRRLRRSWRSTGTRSISSPSARTARRLASSGWDKALFVWDVATGKRLGLPEKVHQDRVTSLAFSLDNGCWPRAAWTARSCSGMRKRASRSATH